jgi:hypothetical protein
MHAAMPATVIRPTLTAAKAEAGAHMTVLAATGMAFVVLVSMPMHQNSSLSI